MSEKQQVVTVEIDHEWSKLNERLFLITTTARYSDGDVKVGRYQVNAAEGQNYLGLKRKLFIEQLQRKIFLGALPGKNAKEVTIRSSWLDIMREERAVTYATRVNYSNWDTMVFSTRLLSPKPAEAEVQQVLLAHAAQAEQFRLLKQWRQAAR